MSVEGAEPMESKRVVVAGAAGFLGSHLVDALTDFGTASFFDYMVFAGATTVMATQVDTSTSISRSAG